jgi:hypothetical protein
MIRDLIEKEVAAVKSAVHFVREKVHPTTVMKQRDFEVPLDDLGQALEDVEASAEPDANARR